MRTTFEVAALDFARSSFRVHNGRNSLWHDQLLASETNQRLIIACKLAISPDAKHVLWGSGSGWSVVLLVGRNVRASEPLRPASGSSLTLAIRAREQFNASVEPAAAAAMRECE